MRKLYRIVAVFALVVGMAGTASTAGAASESSDDPIDGFVALSGVAASSVEVPGDTVLVTSFDLPSYGLTYSRYQQVFGARVAEVLGGQLTFYRDASGETKIVIGAHYPNISPTNTVGVSAAAAQRTVARDIGAGGERITDLTIDPDTGAYFYRVETRRADSRWFHYIDAGNGTVLHRFDALAHTCGDEDTACGFGVQYSDDPGDVKNLTGLTTASGGEYSLLSTDSRQETHDQGSTRRPFLGPVASDDDNRWVLLGDESPAQQALVDAHYYANVTDDYFLAVYGYDWVARAIEAGANDHMEIHAHYSADYNNAFWNGSYIALGDGDQVTFEELTALDVVGHELTHGVTDFTSDLIYEDESGALNESFSDIMGSAMEFWAEATGREPATTLEPDWYIGEDFDLRNDTVPGFRNMADPGEDGDPSHYDERYTGTSDNGGVHTNSGISNHWFYLLVNGGQNSDPTYASGADVTGIGLAAAEQIAFRGFTALPADATFCDARAGTIAVAGGYDAKVADAWDEVGVDAALCGGEDATDVAVTSVSAPSSVVVGDVVSVDVTVENVGNQAVTSDINVTLTDDTDSIDVDTQTIAGGLAAGAFTTLTYSWDTTEESLGDHTLTAGHDFGDDDTNNNSASTTVSVEEPGAGVTVGSITPDSVIAGEPVDVTIAGSGFAASATVELENGSGPAPSVSNIIVSQDGTSITATISTKSGGPPRERVWDVRVTNPDGSTGVLGGGFTVMP